MSETAIRNQFSNDLERLRKRIAKGGGRLFVPEPCYAHFFSPCGWRHIRYDLPSL